MMIIFRKNGLKGMTPMDIRLVLSNKNCCYLRAVFCWVRQNEPESFGTFSDFKLEVYTVYAMFFK